MDADRPASLGASPPASAACPAVGSGAGGSAVCSRGGGAGSGMMPLAVPRGMRTSK
ncbi:hypothetical protein FM110_02985 [Brachybacterium nesterenkovii]|uniref:Uncharacterized protein n=1 Tax=Brachybacterium nesterenkovii TaxID=47847 RepID=A0A1X6WUZ6_9MICO|nr:hypothetical protein FM110_02985 [Brachybacterium nesterenkovii]